jgi:phage tail sheath protein FI
MALKFSESPAVRIREIDLTGIVPAVTSSTGAFVGDFGWGPVNTPVLVGNESELASTFGTPLSGSDAADFLSVAQFLKYSSSAFVVRVGNNGSVTATDGPGVFSAKYPGELGNLVSVHICDSTNWFETVVDSDGELVQVLDSDGNPIPWEYQDLFSSAPEGSERHVVVIFDKGTDEESVLETYEYISTSPTAKLANGSTNYIVDVITAASAWVTIDGLPSGSDYILTGGNNGTSAPTPGNFVTSYGLFADKDTIQIDFLIPPGQSMTDTAVQVELVSIAEQRKDCVAVVSSGTAPSSAQDVLDHVASLKQNSSYLIVDGNWLKIYDKYNDKYITIPAASSTAGIMAATDAASAPWFSPAGTRRGQYIGVVDIAINPSKSQRDALYKAGVNPIVSFPGQGIMLYGDKTHLSRPSAFDRINVRRLFLVIERAIAEAAENVMFEFNDEFTRAEFVNIVEPFLREIQGRRGITDFRLVCDSSNNTTEVIDRNEFVASCFIKPARSINYVTLNFVAVRSGVDFEEVVGTSGV